MKTVTCKEMKEIERRADEAGLSYYQMMENAGTAAAELILGKFPEARNIVILCGKGNNAGDGFVVARKALEAGRSPKVILVDGLAKTTDAITNFGLLEPLGIPVTEGFGGGAELPDGVLKDADLIVDGIYGAGFHGELKPEIRSWTRAVNDLAKTVPVVALDIPSGLDGDLGNPDRDAIRADLTISFHSYKPVHFLPEAGSFCGELALADIGIREI